MQQTFVLHTQNSTTFVLLTQKRAQKSRPKKVGIKVGKKGGKKAAKRRQKSSKKDGTKSLFLNLSCCCLETGLKLVLLLL